MIDYTAPEKPFRNMGKNYFKNQEHVVCFILPVELQ